MKKTLVISLIALVALLTGCNQGASSEDIAKVAYEWEKAKFNNEYDKQQELVFKKGSYEVDKGAKKINSGLKYKDIRFEVYYDKESEYYYVFTDFKNPNGDNAVKDNILLRQKSDVWKVDTSKSLDINREDIKDKFDRQACIHCE
ncbi:hypothetical protein IHV12_20290 [Fictibacillus sp. 7GRE50]|uniref:hypothetical protein n=1 Tax=unclassified Fictibacillus TaxID=2644029 RepID=UPI0018CDBDAC|nr:MULTISPECIES: hypothetical protein [unclassified Fictibacillus]MBH0167267.1 hypothetical protein [Fictibacillus sp. 7GRE50]MBH0171516.1 hypothetical protein [Fictibacillus sp. 18YEL24]